MSILSQDFINSLIKERERLLYSVELIDNLLKNEVEKPYLNHLEISDKVIEYLKTETHPVLMGGIRNAIGEINDTISYSRIKSAVNQCLANGSVVQIKEKGHHPMYKVSQSISHAKTLLNSQL